MICLDTSVVLARLFAEDRSPPGAFRAETSVSSRRLEFDVFNRVHARGAGRSHGADARHRADRVSLVELSDRVLGRALPPFLQPVRTLDALHPATMAFRRAQGPTLSLGFPGAAVRGAVGRMLHRHSITSRERSSGDGGSVMPTVVVAFRETPVGRACRQMRRSGA